MSEALVSQILPGPFEAQYLEYYRILPLELTATHVRVAVSGSTDDDAIADLEREFALPVELVQVGDEDLIDGIRRAYAAAETIVEVVNDLRSDEDVIGGDDHE